MKQKNSLKVTVCELNDHPEAFKEDWLNLINYLKKETTDLLLLPEMPFYPWLFWEKDVNLTKWDDAIQAHKTYQKQLSTLNVPFILGTRPTNKNKKRFNEGFIHTQNSIQATHLKYYLPDETGFWEASWYERGDNEFKAIKSSKAIVGFAICTELWFTDKARIYAKQGCHILATPRCTEKATLDKWLIAGQAAAIMSGAFSLSSNKVGAEYNGLKLGGQGWIINPNGEVLALTSSQTPFVTLKINLNEAEHAKTTYPRYVKE